MKALLILMTALLSVPALAKQPSYKEASALYDQIKQPFYDTSLFYKKPFQERAAYVKAAMVLRDRVEKMFGASSQCYSAANMRSEYIGHLHDFANRLEGRISTQLDWAAVTNPMHMAFSYGESAAAWSCWQPDSFP
ncbi:MAG: hypothetical protein CGU28_04200 [Candidatus Dactylopiibacterium carminicum]|uniref:Uncharacterized protein n=1 Tax=Candidatus Dactylopiibacterium carminicum TaxID=857335 RepID=A0A272EYX3_9RHOO|nr:hypothetical protein [Candidatus Dactylopiibacterium carminicum]KAF7600160.1 hypothetical protein BGI27_03635 [Candidatus Dactylopiibacterium carminicum]PAS94820.1 MAG: hypothetical protein CGU29_02665 [Candidatus Dactylopiibacterium carminicum]PAS97744.1 MAG: hypothetical protein CGU28_04200 [Candidatus Dactylopiibacterium carminicum]PAT00164.1 MAG: hypothetical protein BSR46_03660 [Candidatus Dactylopiibacterium carminicum]